MKLNKIIISLIVLSILGIQGCKFSNAPTDNKQSIDLNEKNCISNILSLDDSLGTIRNHACESISLSETIKQYVRSVNNLDFDNCPYEFTNAFKNHLKAWEDMQKFTNRYPDMRGEMHVLFDEIGKGKDKNIFEPILKEIWDTWAEIEKAQSNSVETSH